MSSVSGISFGGLASGLDTKSIIASLMAIEQRPISLLQTKKKGFQAKKTLYGELETKLTKLFDATKSLRLASTFLEFNAKTNDEDKFLKASADSTASPGTYDIVVDSLAQARTRASVGSVDGDSATHGQGLLRFDIDGLDNPLFVNIEDSAQEPSTLQNIASAINDAGSDLQASVINTGQGAEPYRLVIKSAKEGTEHDFTVSTDSADATLTAFAAEINADTSIPPADARLTINGIDAVRSSNSITDLIQGVTIDLAGEHGVGEKTTITITPNTEDTGEKLKTFVEAYNDIVDFIEGQQAITKSGGESGGDDDDDDIKTNPLFGESALRSIRSTLRGIVGSSVSTGNDSFALLSQIGIKSDREGKLTFTQSDFDKAVIDDPSAIKSLFSAEDTLGNATGIANRIYETIDKWKDSVDGLLKTRTDGIDRNVSDINKQIERAEEKLDRYQVFLTQKYANLEITMARLNSQLGSIGNIGR